MANKYDLWLALFMWIKQKKLAVVLAITLSLISIGGTVAIGYAGNQEDKEIKKSLVELKDNQQKIVTTLEVFKNAMQNTTTAMEQVTKTMERVDKSNRDTTKQVVENLRQIYEVKLKQQKSGG